MNLIAVDDERSALWMLEQAIREAAPRAQLHVFRAAQDALAYAQENRVDAAFLDIAMDEMNGLVLAKRLKEICGDTNIIFATGFSSYMGNAFGMHASGYLLKPIKAEHVAAELTNLRRPVLDPVQKAHVQCFGSFEVFVDGKPILFRRGKAKEALAYLVDRQGANVSKKELAAILWEDQPYSHSVQSHLYVLLTEMTRALAEAGITNWVTKRRGMYSVDTSLISCDYYEFKKGNASAVNRYRGEYMSSYSWAEFTAGFLSQQ